MPTPLRSVRARLGIVVERPWTGMTAGEALRQNHGAESVRPRRAASFTAEAVKSRHRVQPERTHAPCWGGVGLRAASAPERAAPRSGHLALYHHKIASILRASGGRSSRAGPIDDTFDYGCAPDLDSTVLRCVPKQNLWQRGQIGRFITTRQRLKAILRRHRYAVEGPRLWLVEGAVQSEGVPMASRARAKIVARKIKKYHPWGRDI